MTKLPKKIRFAAAISWVATFVGIALAVGPNRRGQYDPSIAILTATYIAIVWYTYVTYRAVHRDEISRLEIRLVRVPAHRTLMLVVMNATKERRITSRVFAELWRAGERQNLAQNADTLGGEPLVLSAGREFAYEISIPAARGVEGSNFGPAVELGEPEFALFRVEVDWEDDLGAGGTVGPEIFSINILDMGVSQFARFTQSERFAKVSMNTLTQPIDRSQFGRLPRSPNTR